MCHYQPTFLCSFLPSLTFNQSESSMSVVVYHSDLLAKYCHFGGCYGNGCYQRSTKTRSPSKHTHTQTHVEILTFTHNNAPRDCLSPLQQTVTLIYLLRCTYAFTRETERDTFSKRFVAKWEETKCHRGNFKSI